MGVNYKLVQGLNKAIKLAGTQVRIRYYTNVYDDVYDEPVRLIQSGTDLWVSGIAFPIESLQNSTEGLLVQQGRLLNSDHKLYLSGGIQLNGSEYLVDIMIGSPGDLYSTIPIGAIGWEAEGQPVYKKQFIRRLTGSLI